MPYVIASFTRVSEVMRWTELYTWGSAQWRRLVLSDLTVRFFRVNGCTEWMSSPMVWWLSGLWCQNPNQHVREGNEIWPTMISKNIRCTCLARDAVPLVCLVLLNSCSKAVFSDVALRLFYDSWILILQTNSVLFEVSKDGRIYVSKICLFTGSVRAPWRRRGPPSPERPTDLVPLLGSLGKVVQIPAAGSHQGIFRREDRNLLCVARWDHTECYKCWNM